jgi:hypothetical protein
MRYKTQQQVSKLSLRSEHDFFPLIRKKPFNQDAFYDRNWSNKEIRRWPTFTQEKFRNIHTVRYNLINYERSGARKFHKFHQSVAVVRVDRPQRENGRRVMCGWLATEIIRTLGVNVHLECRDMVGIC